MKSYYEILEISSTATSEEIKKAFRKCAKKYHPDRDVNDPTLSEKFKEINEAYSVLSDEEERKKYDEKLLKAKGFKGKSSTGNSSSNKKNHNMGNPIESLNKQFEQFFGFSEGSNDIKKNFSDNAVNPIDTSNIFNSFFRQKKK